MTRSRPLWRTLPVVFWAAFWVMAFEVVTRDTALATRLGIRHLEDLGQAILVVSCAGAAGAIWALVEIIRARTLVQRILAAAALVCCAALASLGRGLL